MDRAKGLPAAHRGSASLRIWTLDRLAASNQLWRQREVQQKLEPGDCVPTISASATPFNTLASLSCGNSMRNRISNCIVRGTSVSTAQTEEGTGLDLRVKQPTGLPGSFSHSFLHLCDRDAGLSSCLVPVAFSGTHPSLICTSF
jgi:hypothetical protein